MKRSIIQGTVIQMPKRAAKDGTLYKRSDGRWEAKFTTGINKATGKPIRKSVYGATQSAVKEEMHAALAEIDSGEYMEPSKMKLSAWMDRWLEDYAGDKKYGTVKSYKAQVKTNITPFIGGIRLCDLTTDDVKHLYNLLAKGTGTKKALSPKSVKNVHGILHEALSVAVALGHIKSNPADNKIVLKFPKAVKKQIKPLTDEQIAAFMAEVDKDEYAAYFKTVLFSGMRESEAIGLTWDCVDFENNLIRIEKQLQKRPLADGGYVFMPLKNNKTRTVQVAPFVTEILRTEKIREAEKKLRAGSLWEGWQNAKERQTALVFTNEVGRHLIQNTVVAHFKKIVGSIDSPETRVHDLRHTFAVLSLQNGDDFKTVQENLGHATASFTLDVYGHVSTKMQQDSADRMQRYISKIGNE